MGKAHTFILEPGQWIGEGTVSFSSSPDQLYFITKWEIDEESDEGVFADQEVKMEGTEEVLHNSFQIYDISPTAFTVMLENEIMGQVAGTGIIDDKTIAWEFRGETGPQGFEVYERHKDGEYSFHAEYCSPDQFRTIIDGRIRKHEETE